MAKQTTAEREYGRARRERSKAWAAHETAQKAFVDATRYNEGRCAGAYSPATMAQAEADCQAARADVALWDAIVVAAGACIGQQS